MVGRIFVAYLNFIALVQLKSSMRRVLLRNCNTQALLRLSVWPTRGDEQVRSEPRPANQRFHHYANKFVETQRQAWARDIDLQVCDHVNLMVLKHPTSVSAIVLKFKVHLRMGSTTWSLGTTSRNMFARCSSVQTFAHREYWRHCQWNPHHMRGQGIFQECWCTYWLGCSTFGGHDRRNCKHWRECTVA